MADKQSLSTTNTAQDTGLVAPSTAFVELFEADKNRLYAYIYAYVMNHSAADDIFQETSMILWREFEKFELGSNFSKWANTIAFNRVQEFRRANNKYSLGLSDDFLQEFSQNLAAGNVGAEQAPDKWWHLQACSKLLPPPLKNIYHHFYLEKLTAQDIADTSGKSIHAVRKAVHQLRKNLFNCVAKKLAEDKQ